MELIERQKRYAEITATLARHDVAFLLDAIGLHSLAPAQFQHRDQDKGLTEPERVIRVIEELGPTYVKLGQILSTRPDLLPQRYIVELKKLQDDVAALPFDAIEAVIVEELGKPVDELFASVDRTALAAASIGQVHRVVLNGGTEGVVKVQRPGIEATIRRDLAVLRGLAELARMSGALAPIDPVAILREFERSLLRELDYVVEGHLTDEFRQQHASDPEILIPEVFWDHTGKRVLALEFVDGIKVSEIDRLRESGHDLPRVARKVVDVILSQVFVHGFFHADPHPGNLMVTADGRLALIDFGMSGRFDRPTLRALVDIVRDLQDRDAAALTNHLLHHEMIGYDVDLREVRAALREMFRTLGHAELHEQIDQLMRFTVKFQVAFPPDLFFLDKVFGTLDGAVRTLDPTLTTNALVKEFLPQLAARLAEDWESYARQLLAKLVEADTTLVELPAEILRVFKRVDAGHLVVQQSWSLSEKGARQISRLAAQVGLLGLGLTLLLAGSGDSTYTAAGLSVFAAAFAWLLLTW